MKITKQKSKKAAANFYVAAAFLIGFIIFSYFSITMERPKDWLTAPGLSPLALSILGFVLFAKIAYNSIRKGALQNQFNNFQIHFVNQWLNHEQTKRFAKASLAICVYYFLLLKFFPFEIATLIFLVVIQYLFSSKLSWKKNLIVSVLVTLIVTISFRGFFGILLPGEADLLGNLIYWFKHF